MLIILKFQPRSWLVTSKVSCLCSATKIATTSEESKWFDAVPVFSAWEVKIAPKGLDSRRSSRSSSFSSLKMTHKSNRYGLSRLFRRPDSWVSWSQIGKRIFKDPIEVARLDGAKVLLGSLLQASREHYIPVAVIILELHYEATSDDEADDCISPNEREYEGIVFWDRHWVWQSTRMGGSFPTCLWLGSCSIWLLILPEYHVLRAYCQQACQKCENWALSGFNRMLRYLQGAENLGIMIWAVTSGSSMRRGHLIMQSANSNSDQTRKYESRNSTKGYMIQKNGVLVTWSSFMQRCVDASCIIHWDPAPISSGEHAEGKILWSHLTGVCQVTRPSRNLWRQLALYLLDHRTW